MSPEEKKPSSDAWEANLTQSGLSENWNRIIDGYFFNSEGLLGITIFSMNSYNQLAILGKNTQLTGPAHNWTHGCAAALGRPMASKVLPGKSSTADSRQTWQNRQGRTMRKSSKINLPDPLKKAWKKRHLIPEFWKLVQWLNGTWNKITYIHIISHIYNHIYYFHEWSITRSVSWCFMMVSRHTSFCLPVNPSAFFSGWPHFRMTIVSPFFVYLKMTSKMNTSPPEKPRKNPWWSSSQLARNQKRPKNLRRRWTSTRLQKDGETSDDFGWLRGDFPWEKDGNMVIRNSKHADLSLMMFGKSSNVTEGVSISMHFTHARTSSEKTLKIWPKRLRMKCLQANKKLQRQTSQCLMFCLCCFRLQRLFPLFLLIVSWHSMCTQCQANKRWIWWVRMDSCALCTSKMQMISYDSIICWCTMIVMD